MFLWIDLFLLLVLYVSSWFSWLHSFSLNNNSFRLWMYCISTQRSSELCSICLFFIWQYNTVISMVIGGNCSLWLALPDFPVSMTETFFLGLLCLIVQLYWLHSLPNPRSISCKYAMWIGNFRQQKRVFILKCDVFSYITTRNWRDSITGHAFLSSYGKLQSK